MNNKILIGERVQIDDKWYVIAASISRIEKFACVPGGRGPPRTHRGVVPAGTQRSVA
jgi:hypothetical protein